MEDKNVRDVILDLLREKPMTVNELYALTGMRKELIGNIMTNLKNKSMIEIYAHGLGNKNNYWVAVKDAPTYASTVVTGKIKQLVNPNTQYSPNATMKVSISDYHTTSRKSKINAWMGYGSFGMI